MKWTQIAAAAMGTALSYLLGAWDTPLIVLTVFLGLDYLSGVCNAIVDKSLSSAVGFAGIRRKLMVIVILIMAVLLDRLLGNSAPVFRSLVCYFYIANEGISILENAGRLGLPIPKKLLSILAQLKKRGDNA